MDGTWSVHGGDDKCKILVKNLEKKRDFWSYGHRWEGNIKMNLY
jgi:hypothetical protein